MAAPKKKRPKPAAKNPRPKRAPTKTSWQQGESGNPETQVQPGQVLNPTGNNGTGTHYKPEYCEIARAMCQLGATTADLAKAFGVWPTTIHKWMTAHEEFAEAISVGKGNYDERVERALAERAIGYTYEAEKVFCFQGQIVTHKLLEHVPPDPNAAMKWLTNRRRDRWQDRQAVEHTGKDGGAIEIDQKRDEVEVARRIAFVLARANATEVEPSDGAP